MPELLPIAKAAEVLGERPGTVRRWCREGLPYRPGRKGRSHAALVDVEVARQWSGTAANDRVLLTLADDLQKVLAAATLECFKQSAGTDKRRLAGVLSAAYYMNATAILDRLRLENREVPDLTVLPPEIEYLRKIAKSDSF